MYILGDNITSKYGKGNGKQWPFGWGTVYHACGTLRMPWKANRDASFNNESVVDEDLKVRDTTRTVYLRYVCHAYQHGSKPRSCTCRAGFETFKSFGLKQSTMLNAIYQ